MLGLRAVPRQAVNLTETAIDYRLSVPAWMGVYTPCFPRLSGSFRVMVTSCICFTVLSWFPFLGWYPARIIVFSRGLLQRCPPCWADKLHCHDSGLIGCPSVRFHRCRHGVLPRPGTVHVLFPGNPYPIGPSGLRVPPRWGNR